MITLRRIALLASVSLLSLSTTSCLRQARAERNRAEADRAEAQAELARAQADSIRKGEPQGEYVEVEAEPRPPATIVEVAPPQPSNVHVWIAGCHEWRHGAWVWMPGRWVVPPHSGAGWVRGHWVRHHRGWVWVGGGWR